ncbi:hypothetical protein FNV43_RR18502 [Rhamnella rubrinervis]|uniref:Uncharacterized protein n=1 Tax=Rhamnella rubrinervis TaxID=2594499 RepID=A0A8K0E5Z6_9ROSA|nr:hypothetical protein FNV43_RR18502 [Rhamnella rubrinervis]
MLGCKIAETPIEANLKLEPAKSEDVVDMERFQRLVEDLLRYCAFVGEASTRFENSLFSAYASLHDNKAAIAIAHNLAVIENISYTLIHGHADRLVDFLGYG